MRVIRYLYEEVFNDFLDDNVKVPTDSQLANTSTRWDPLDRD